ncbi:MAG: hypothetical protein CL862_04545 [Cyanobium sp. NAT70]|nr:hypothetical protein [Cyanobium sp. NAT70]
MLKLEQLAAVVVAAGLAIVSYWLFFSWAGGGGYERRGRFRNQAALGALSVAEPISDRSGRDPSCFHSLDRARSMTRRGLQDAVSFASVSNPIV